MIDKYLVCGQQIFLTSCIHQIDRGHYRIISLRLPLDIYWKLKIFIKNINFIINNKEDKYKIFISYQKLFQMVAIYAVYEKDRYWLYKHGKSNF